MSITKEESLRLYGQAFEIDGEIIHPSRVTVHGGDAGLQITRLNVKFQTEEQVDELIVRMKNEIPSDMPEGAVRFIKEPICLSTMGKIDEQRREEVLENSRENPPQVAFTTEQPRRYFADCDGDGHYFLIPVECREEWNAWLEIPTDDERAWTAPGFAHPLGGGPSSLTFEQVEDNAKPIP